MSTSDVTPTGTPAWQRLPSWAVVAVVATHPADVAAVIVRAVKAIG
jgi:hypothetical protein